MSTIWQREDFQRAAGGTLRPGGLALTRRGLDLCARLCGLEAGALVLDLGCGTGATLHLLHELGYRGLGLDKKTCPAWTGTALQPARTGHGQAEPAPQPARTRQAPQHPQADLEGPAKIMKKRDHCGLPFARADLERLPLPDAVADAALCECVLSLLPVPETALAEWRRTLRPGGVLLLTDFYLRPAAPRNTGYSPLPHPDSCLSGARSPAEWQALLVAAGFHVCLHEDHSADLAALAARLLWYGQADLPEFFGLKSSSGDCLRPPASGTRYGYGLWIARKADC
jgi:SAM-dependent methyltransferase